MQHSANSTEKSSNVRQFSKFLVVGFLNFAISFAVFYLFFNYWKLSGPFYGLLGQTGKNLESMILQLGASSLDATLANIFGYGAGTINSFIWNKFWTFQVKYQAGTQFGRFILLNIACLVLSSLSLFIFTDFLGFSYGWIWFITMSVVTMANFSASKYWVFVNL